MENSYQRRAKHSTHKLSVAGLTVKGRYELCRGERHIAREKFVLAEVIATRNEFGSCTDAGLETAKADAYFLVAARQAMLDAELTAKEIELIDWGKLRETFRSEIVWKTLQGKGNE